MKKSAFLITLYKMPISRPLVEILACKLKLICCFISILAIFYTFEPKFSNCLAKTLKKCSNSNLGTLAIKRRTVKNGWSHCTMASKKPGSVEQGGDELLENLRDFGNSLLTMENMDRSSPEIWPESVPGVTDFINSYNSTHIPPKMPYSKEITEEDRIYMQQLASLPAASLIAKVKELHDISYQLGVEESKEISRGKCLNIFSSSSKEKGEK